MSDLERKTISPFLKKLISFVMPALLITPSATNAELLLQLHDAWDSHPVPEISRQAVKRPVEVCLNENGDLEIRRSDVLLTMAYTPPNDIIEPQERLRIAQRQDCPSISGISLKVGFRF